MVKWVENPDLIFEFDAGVIRTEIHNAKAESPGCLKVAPQVVKSGKNSFPFYFSAITLSASA